MTSDKLPAVLTFSGKQSSLSVERALRQIRMLLMRLQMIELDEGKLQDCEVSLDDLALMIKAIER